MTLADTLLNQRGPLAQLLMADPEAPTPDPKRGTVNVTVVSADIARIGFLSRTRIDEHRP